MGESICIFPDCERKKRSRGLCINHFVAARRLIIAGRADESDLMERGLMLGNSLYATKEVFSKGSKVKGKETSED